MLKVQVHVQSKSERAVQFVSAIM